MADSLSEAFVPSTLRSSINSPLLNCSTFSILVNISIMTSSPKPTKTCSKEQYEISKFEEKMQTSRNNYGFN